MSVQEVTAVVLPLRRDESGPATPAKVHRLPVVVVAVVLAVVVVCAGLAIRALRQDEPAQARPEVGVVAVCAWSDAQNPSGLPICEDRTRSSS